MADEDTIIEPVAEPENRAQERITQLSDKVRVEAEGRAAAEARASAAEKKAAFADSYADLVATNPLVKDHKADIEAKVLAGYTPQDAMYAVLGGAGKLGQTQAPVADITGGSASTTLPNTGTKSTAEMTQAERRAKLAEEIVWN